VEYQSDEEDRDAQTTEPRGEQDADSDAENAGAEARRELGKSCAPASAPSLARDAGSGNAKGDQTRTLVRVTAT